MSNTWDVDTLVGSDDAAEEEVQPREAIFSVENRLGPRVTLLHDNQRGGSDEDNEENEDQDEQSSLGYSNYLRDLDDMDDRNNPSDTDSENEMELVGYDPAGVLTYARVQGNGLLIEERAAPTGVAPGTILGRWREADADPLFRSNQWTAEHGLNPERLAAVRREVEGWSSHGGMHFRRPVSSWTRLPASFGSARRRPLPTTVMFQAPTSQPESQEPQIVNVLRKDAEFEVHTSRSEFFNRLGRTFGRQPFLWYNALD